MEFETLEALEQHFQQQLEAAADDQARLQVRADRGDALGAFNQREAERRQQSDWRSELLTQFPHARQEEIVGVDRDAMEAAAKASHDHVQNILAGIEAQRQQQQQDLEARGQARYGSGNASGGGGIPPAPTDPYRSATEKMQSELAKTTGEGSRRPFDLREIYPEAEDAIFDRMAKRQSAIGMRSLSSKS